jgi:hypothetical protein
LLYDSVNGIDREAKWIKNKMLQRFCPALNARFEDLEKAKAAHKYNNIHENQDAED